MMMAYFKIFTIDRSSGSCDETSAHDSAYQKFTISDLDFLMFNIGLRLRSFCVQLGRPLSGAVFPLAFVWNPLYTCLHLLLSSRCSSETLRPWDTGPSSLRKWHSESKLRDVLVPEICSCERVAPYVDLNSWNIKTLPRCTSHKASCRIFTYI